MSNPAPTLPPLPSTIANLPTAGAITGSEFVPISQNGVTVKTTANSLTGELSSVVGGNGIAVTTVGPQATVSLTSPVASANGGTGQSSVAAAFTSFFQSVATTLGDLIYGGASGAPTRLGGNTSTTPNFYTSTGTGAAALAPTLTSSTGTGNVVLANSPTLVTPALGAATATSIQLGSGAVLSDYETGTWTAAFVCGTSGTATISSSNKTGRYVKIGDMVFITGFFSASSVSSPVGTFTITGLPFTSGNVGQDNSAIAVAAGTLQTGAVTQITGEILQSTTAILMQQYASGGETALAGNVTTNSFFYISGCYAVN